MDSGDHCSLDVGKLAESVEGKLRIFRPFSNNCSIYRVPKRLRELNEKAYTPQVISIGPLHYGKEELKEMEEHKRLYVREFLDLSQLPFFIVEDLFNLSKILHRREEYSLIELARHFLSSTWDSWVPEDILEQVIFSKLEHFVDFLRICQKPSQKMQSKKLASTLATPSVAELHEAGIKFKLGSSINRLDIKFDDDKGTLEIPQIYIEDHTEILYRNLQAFEQCNYDDNRYVCNYINMLSLLVPAAKDVEILANKGIIEN